MYYTRKGQHTDYYSVLISETIKNKLECGPMPNVMVALPNIGGGAPSVQRRKVWLTPCSNAAKTRNHLKFAGVPQTG